MAEGDDAVRAMCRTNVAADLALQAFGATLLARGDLIDAFGASR
jgi:hypothetical protein